MREGESDSRTRMQSQCHAHSRLDRRSYGCCCYLLSGAHVDKEGLGVSCEFVKMGGFHDDHCGERHRGVKHEEIIAKDPPGPGI